MGSVLSIRVAPWVAVFVLGVCGAAVADDGVGAYGLAGELNRLTYDGRSAGMGGAALAVEGLPSAPVENAATLGLGRRGDIEMGFFGESPAGPAGTGNYFLAGPPYKAIVPHHFAQLYGWATGLAGRQGYGEVTVFGSVGAGQLVFFGTKGGIARPAMTADTDAGEDTVTVRGPGIEYETLGSAYGTRLSGNTYLGLAVKQIRIFRAAIDYTARRAPDGTVRVRPDSTVIQEGLAWAEDLSVYYRGSGRWSGGLVLRHLNTPRFHSFRSAATWLLAPSADIGTAWRSGRDIVAADLRNVWGANGGGPMLRIGWEHSFGSHGRWLARAGLRDGRPSLGLGWHGSHGSVDFSVGPNPAQRASFSASVVF